MTKKKGIFHSNSVRSIPFEVIIIVVNIIVAIHSLFPISMLKSLQNGLIGVLFLPQHICGQKWRGTKANASHCITLHCIASHIESKLKISLHQMTEIVNKLRHKSQHMHLCLTSKEIFLSRFASHARSILILLFSLFLLFRMLNTIFDLNHRIAFEFLSFRLSEQYPMKSEIARESTYTQSKMMTSVTWCFVRSAMLTSINNGFDTLNSCSKYLRMNWFL